LKIRGQEVAGQLARRWAREIRRAIEAGLQLELRIDASITRRERALVKVSAARREDEQKYNATHG
jgi:hypothetical protein